jgi:hypothetical protein
MGRNVLVFLPLFVSIFDAKPPQHAAAGGTPIAKPEREPRVYYSIQWFAELAKLQRLPMPHEEEGKKEHEQGKEPEEEEEEAKEEEEEAKEEEEGRGAGAAAGPNQLNQSLCQILQSPN